MSVADPHDKRLFNRFVKFNDDGTVAATVDVADGASLPVDAQGTVFVDVTSLAPADFHAVRVDPALLTARKAKTAETVRTRVAALAAEAEEALAQDVLLRAVTTAVKNPPKNTPAKDETPVVVIPPNIPTGGHG